jgi:hypothetical protein
MISKRLLPALALLGLPLAAQAVDTPTQLITAMHDRYASCWYHTLEFEQKSTTIHPDGKRGSVNWHEEMKVPGKLRIDIAPKGSGDGILFVNDTQYNFKGGKLENSTPRIHPLLVLGFDVYGQPVQTTLDKVKKLGFDLSTIHQEDWQGRPAYVVGAKQGDLKSPQFWIDKERLVFVRSLQPNPRHPEVTSEVRFDDYVQEGCGWVAKHVQMFADGKPVFEEEYSDIHASIPLEDVVFDPSQFAAHAKK